MSVTKNLTSDENPLVGSELQPANQKLKKTTSLFTCNIRRRRYVTLYQPIHTSNSSDYIICNRLKSKYTITDTSTTIDSDSSLLTVEEVTAIHDITVSKIGQWTYLTYITVAVSAAK